MAAIRFLLNGQWCSEDSVPPTMTVLDYLRTVRRLTGTKEGCAEGDCGACTIMVGRREEGRLRYDAVNSCLMLVPQLEATAVVTVEGLTAPDGALHPVQHALLEADATQCGFCTPGFAMAMAAFQHGGEPARDELIHEALAGNLCRCTGYRPIVDACRGVAGGALDHLAERARADAAGLAGLSPIAEYRQGEQCFYFPHTLPELARLVKQHPEAQLWAGGTDLGLVVAKERRWSPALIATSFVPELKRITVGPDWIEFGAAVTYSEALPYFDVSFPALGAVVRRLGSRQIRNLGTMAGNLATASPIGDTIPCLFALDAAVVVRSIAGARPRTMEKFITGYRRTSLAPGEFIESIRLPRLVQPQQFHAFKLSKRFDQDIAAVTAAFRIALADGVVQSLRAAFGGMGPTAKRATAVEEAIIGQPWTASTLAGIDQALARDFAPMDDHRGSAAYRLRAAANLLRRLQIETARPDLAGVAPLRLEAL
ncbi:MAG: xanthine dehydrogenase small subunit [Alphaproteobacteria bacterium]|nr:xanthine dehydrogenase small subunit [Alphaproteobacteria bacterium]